MAVLAARDAGLAPKGARTSSQPAASPIQHSSAGRSSSRRTIHGRTRGRQRAVRWRRGSASHLWRSCQVSIRSLTPGSTRPRRWETAGAPRHAPARHVGAARRCGRATRFRSSDTSGLQSKHWSGACCCSPPTEPRSLRGAAERLARPPSCRPARRVEWPGQHGRRRCRAHLSGPLVMARCKRRFPSPPSGCGSGEQRCEEPARTPPFASSSNATSREIAACDHKVPRHSPRPVLRGGRAAPGAHTPQPK
mmetsp:Transcript_4065/g.9555  ORF Transcript_4065/g.9555 Transcript_4065/m.9555 type:complete len:250 (-) Transcript_4065:53-802(-)